MYYFIHFLCNQPQQTAGAKSLDPKDYGIDFEEDEDGVAYGEGRFTFNLVYFCI